MPDDQQVKRGRSPLGNVAAQRIQPLHMTTAQKNRGPQLHGRRLRAGQPPTPTVHTPATRVRVATPTARGWVCGNATWSRPPAHGPPLPAGVSVDAGKGGGEGGDVHPLARAARGGGEGGGRGRWAEQWGGARGEAAGAAVTGAGARGREGAGGGGREG